MNILVTGANGLLGQKLVYLLSGTDGVTLHATSRGPARMGTVPPSCTYHALDLTDEGGVSQLIQNLKPDCVIHTASLTLVDECELDRDKCYLHNVKAVAYLLKACKPLNCHFIYLSTDFIFSGEEEHYKETDAPAPVNYYGECKLQAENLVQASGLRWAILRTVLVYGYTQGMSRSNIVLWVKKSLEEGINIKVVTDQLRTPTLAEDLAEGCKLAALKRAQGVYHISGSEPMTPYEIAVATADYFGLDRGLITKADSSNFTQPAKRPPRTGLDISKARSELGYEPRPFMEGLSLLKKQLDA
ncbi:NAD(P)-dependent oxidoreductase [Roseivirga sp. BDSF3-8]|uniref:SDR family oxidoreductase n=1 Tax=Roseivirga sp. BDSF3-8 TaxID=3241598 RepID=UPI003531B4AA